ncbi:MAG: tol-pal system protein YbgF [Deltaproteobacteria bacterium]
MLIISCAHQEDVIILDQRLSRVESLSKKLDQRTTVLEEKAERLDRQYQSSEAVIEASQTKLSTKLAETEERRREEDLKARNQYAEIKSVLEALREEVQSLRGRLEEADYAMKQQANAAQKSDKETQVKLDRIAIHLNQMEARVAYLEQYLNLESDTVRSPRQEAVAPESKKLSQKELYLSAKQAFDEGDFETARAGFERIINEFPKSENADNAQFWIGEIYYREKCYEKAILEYQKVIEKYPNGNKVPAALLKQGFAFLSLGDKANARLILKELSKKFPDTNEGKIATQKLKELQ